MQRFLDMKLEKSRAVGFFGREAILERGKRGMWMKKYFSLDFESEQDFSEIFGNLLNLICLKLNNKIQIRGFVLQNQKNLSSGLVFGNRKSSVAHEIPGKFLFFFKPNHSCSPMTRPAESSHSPIHQAFS